VELFSLARVVFGRETEWRDRRTLDVLERDVVFVAEVGPATAGYAALERSGDAVRIDQLLVGPGHDDEEVEARLLEWTEGYAISLGARTLQAVVENDNVTATAFYRERGFVSVADDVLELVLPQRL
jgi:N-acetylglutamate synthase-like GNAT family acetyltransferase